MNSVLLDSSFLISLSDDSRADHDTAKEYYRSFIKHGVVMHLSTIVICEFEVKQRITDLGLNNFIVLPFNYEDAVIAAKAFSNMYPQRWAGDNRVAVSADTKIIGQCIAAGVSFFITGDDKCCNRIKRTISSNTNGSSLALPQPISIKDPYDSSWFNSGQHTLTDLQFYDQA